MEKLTPEEIAPSAGESGQATHRHVKKPIEVQGLCYDATWEPDLTPCVVYRELPDGRVWVRPDFHERYKPLTLSAVAAPPSPMQGMETTAQERAHWLSVYAGKTFNELPMLLRTLRDLDRALAEITRLTEHKTWAAGQYAALQAKGVRDGIEAAAEMDTTL